MFRGSNIVTSGGTFIHQSQRHQHYHAGKGTITVVVEELINKGLGGFELLQEHVAPAAFYDSGERFDPPKCYPNTRVAVQRKIMDWIMGLDPQALNALVMWLYGPAGAGKSAIAQSIAELCSAEGYLLASFFFGRSDPSRNHPQSLFPTIAYQISTILPAVKVQLLAAINRDPLIFTRSLSTQLSALVIEPIQSLVDSGYFSDPRSPRLILIDGLDECLDRQGQKTILDLISDALFRRKIPLIFFICSRPEYEISGAFSSADMRGILTTIVLDNSYLPADDIRLFLREKFNSIKESHPMNRIIPSPWPTENMMDFLVWRSSGQFIYASTVVKYVASPRHRPTERLKVILNLQAPGRDVPFAELDALYLHILSSVEEIERVLDLLSVLMDGLYYSVPDLERILVLDPGGVEILLCDLGSIVGPVENREGRLKIFHASLVDFLLDPQRSKNFFIDIGLKRNQHLQACFQVVSDSAWLGEVNLAAEFLIGHNISNALPTPEFKDAILKFSLEPFFTAALDMDIPPSSAHHPLDIFYLKFTTAFFSWLKRMKFDDGETLYSIKLKPFYEYLKGHLSKYYQDENLTFLVAVFNQPKRKYLERGGFSGLDNLIFQLDEYHNEVDINGLQLHMQNRFRSGGPHRPDQFRQLIYEFLQDPQLSGEYALGGTRYATAALYCLKYLCDHHSQTLPLKSSRKEYETRRYIPRIWRKQFNKSTKTESSAKRQRRRRRHWNQLLIEKGEGRRGSWYPETISLEAFFFVLSCLPYLLSRSTISEELVNFADQHAFAIRSCKFSRATSRARHALTAYLKKYLHLVPKRPYQTFKGLPTIYLAHVFERFHLHQPSSNLTISKFKIPSSSDESDIFLHGYLY